MDAKPLLGAFRDRAYVRDRLGAGGDLHHLHARQQRGGGGRHQVRLLFSLFFFKQFNLSYLRMPDDLREGKDRMIFGNLESIFEWHRE